MTVKRKRNKTQASELLHMIVRNANPVGLTIERAANRCNVSKLTMYRWMHGFMFPRLQQMIRIEEAFGISPRAWKSDDVDE